MDTQPPRTAPPRGACDSHFHVIGPVTRFPFAEQRSFTPNDVPIEAAIRMHDTIGIERGVAVQCHPHGTDNSALIDALLRYPKRLRGVAIVEPDISRRKLQRMADVGVQALRFHYLPNHTGYSTQGLQAFEKLARSMADLGLHIQLMVDATALDDILHYFNDWPLPIVVDHMGNVDAKRGPDQHCVQRMRSLLADGRIWVKVSAAYRISVSFPDYDDAARINEALVQANPEQILWGSDWPHTRLATDMPEDGHLFDLFNAWVPQLTMRHKILVDNPSKLYRFPNE
jgi:predicted TIM-barrel fold metal-dependent hydrolase